MNRRVVGALAAVAAVCGGGADMSPKGSFGSGPQEQMRAMAAAGGAAGKTASPSAPNNEEAGNQPVKAALAAMNEVQPDRFLIKNATVTIEAKDVRKATAALAAAALA